jgi:hypothetical protein
MPVNPCGCVASCGSSFLLCVRVVVEQAIVRISQEVRALCGGYQ